MMRRLALAGMVIGTCLTTPAFALEHEVTIEHPAGTIAADYDGAVKVETRQVGTAGVAGRPNTLRCNWTASLSVERTAKVGDSLQSRRSMMRENVASGSKPGWCETRAKAIDELVDAKRDKFYTAMLDLVEQDRTVILAEADGVSSNNREG